MIVLLYTHEETSRSRKLTGCTDGLFNPRLGPILYCQTSIFLRTSLYGRTGLHVSGDGMGRYSRLVVY